MGAARERPQETEGAGSCKRANTSFSENNGGCIYLISTGQSDSPSYFGDASADGDDVFFFTRQSLVGQDQDLNVDVYDARVDGGIASQNPAPSPAPCTGETSCRTPPDAPPALGVPSSATITGSDNLTPVEPKRAAKPKVKKKKKRRKKHSGKAKKKARAKAKTRGAARRHGS